jgi:hypothetical protein
LGEDFGEIIVEVLEGDEGEVVGMKFIYLCFEGNTKIIHCVMYSERHNIYLQTRYDG